MGDCPTAISAKLRSPVSRVSELFRSQYFFFSIFSTFFHSFRWNIGRSWLLIISFEPANPDFYRHTLRLAKTAGGRDHPRPPHSCTDLDSGGRRKAGTGRANARSTLLLERKESTAARDGRLIGSRPRCTK